MDKINFQLAKYRGVIRRMDALGRIAIPASFRREFGFNQFDEMELFATSNHEILIRKFTIDNDENQMIKIKTAERMAAKLKEKATSNSSAEIYAVWVDMIDSTLKDFSEEIRNADKDV